MHHIGVLNAPTVSVTVYSHNVVDSTILVQDFFAESVTTRVVIPEGSSDVQVSLGRIRAEVTEERTFTYLDTMIGRPTKIIQV